MGNCKKLQRLSKAELQKVTGGTGGSGLDPVMRQARSVSYGPRGKVQP
ncbi:hypothetical protein [Pseudoalteromonas aurantia]|nr:hypothetical protein [Pseudoalteromonas aurantia]